MHHMRRKLKSIIGLALTATILGACSTQSTKYLDADAIAALDNLTATMGELESCSFTLQTTEISIETGSPEASFKKTDAYLNGPSQMYFYTENNKGRRGVWYNETELSVFMFDDNTFQTIAVPERLMQVIDSLNGNFKMEFPAADFFYPSLADDVIQNSDSVFLLENKTIDGVDHLQVMAFNGKNEVYIIIDSETYLPKQLEIYGKGEKLGESYISTLSNWRINPNLPESLFQFSPGDAAEAQLITAN
jgi:outer membrane lipoprotein-sorting protein